MAKRKKITLNEFKAWLEGVEELQPSEWSPNADQWKLIRNKINMIKEQPASTPKTSTQQGQQNIGGGQPAPQSQPASSSLTVPPPPPSTGGIPDNVEGVEMSPKASQFFKESGQHGARKTPDIDTSGGGYGSSFE